MEQGVEERGAGRIGYNVITITHIRFAAHNGHSQHMPGLASPMAGSYYCCDQGTTEHKVGAESKHLCSAFHH